MLTGGCAPAQMVGISALLIMARADVLVGTAPGSLEAIRWGVHAALGVLWAGAFLAVWSLSNCASLLAASLAPPRLHAASNTPFYYCTYTGSSLS